MEWHSLGVFVRSQEWGSWAEWFTGLVTAGTLLIAILIIRRDRKKEERADADSFLAWQSMLIGIPDHSTFTMHVQFFNAGNSPILRVTIRTPPGAKEFAYQGLKRGPHEDIWIVKPRESAETFVSLSELEIHPGLIVTFQDRRGRFWARDIDSNVYVKDRQLKKWAIQSRAMNAKGDQVPVW
jgi:hypothetical protein